ncbi:MAG: hypothetical protein J6S87_09415 [Bacteroidales bacterium]|nr:hypothetical protein [Bacteroidales bacterium]
MQLTGTTIQERFASAIAFAKAHRSHEYDCDKTAGIYRMAGVPFTEAAEKFWREWYGVWDCIDFYPDRPNVVNSDGEHHIERIDFYFSLVEDAEKLEVGYTPESYLGWPDSEGIIRKKYGDDTVPVSEGGYYYPSDIWVCSAGRIISVLPEDFEEIGDEHVWNTLDEFLCFVLEGEHPARIEKVLARKELEGSLDENVSTAIAFAKAHGGFKHCRMTSAAARCDPIDIRRIAALEDSASGNFADSIADGELSALLLEILKEQTPKWYDGIMPPGRIWFVEE